MNICVASVGVCLPDCICVCVHVRVRDCVRVCMYI